MSVYLELRCWRLADAFSALRPTQHTPSRTHKPATTSTAAAALTLLHRLARRLVLAARHQELLPHALQGDKLTWTETGQQQGQEQQQKQQQ